MSLEQSLGVVAILIGLLNLAAYLAYVTGRQVPVFFWKAEHLRARWGHLRGALIHLLAYVLAPLVLGAIIVLGG